MPSTTDSAKVAESSGKHGGVEQIVESGIEAFGGHGADKMCDEIVTTLRLARCLPMTETHAYGFQPSKSFETPADFDPATPPHSLWFVR